MQAIHGDDEEINESVAFLSLSLSHFFYFFIFIIVSPDVVLYLCEKEHVEGGMIFQLLEDLTEMSTMRNCKDVFGYIESKQDILGKVCAFVLVIRCFFLPPSFSFSFTFHSRL